MSDIYNLHRFLDAQEGVYGIVLTELRAGRKSSHWIWFIFPQITGLGHSNMAQQFAIVSLDEAKAYLQHPVRPAISTKTSTATADTPLRQAWPHALRGQRAGSPLATSTYYFEYASVSPASTRPSRLASWRFRHELS